MTKICKVCKEDKDKTEFKYQSALCFICFKIRKKDLEKERLKLLSNRIIIPISQVCNKCDIEKLANEFYISKIVLNGLERVCKTCRGKTLRKSSQKYKKENYEKLSIYRHKFYEENKYRIDFRYKEYKHAAKRRNIEFSLTLEQVNLITKNLCLYCNQFSLNRDHVGIDRINNDIGYILSNVIPCCSICNIAKGSLTFDQFKLHIEKIYKNGITELSAQTWFRSNLL